MNRKFHSIHRICFTPLGLSMFLVFTWHATAAAHSAAHSARHATRHSASARSFSSVSFGLLLSALRGGLLLGGCQLGFFGRLRFGQPLLGFLLCQRL
jgi:predicted lipid-binding transport protein (Tim44 family)